MGSVSLEPIGTVHNEVKQVENQDWDGVISEITLNSELEEALEGIEQFSHVIVLFWLDRVPPSKRRLKKIHPRGRLDIPMRGILATRTQYRPNPVGVKTVKLLERRGNVLKVLGLDALDGTPVIDIKPYDPEYDGAPGAVVPKKIEQSNPMSDSGTGRRT